MNIKIRALVSFIALSFVAITGPILVLYAQGYRYNFNKNRIEQTGVMFIKSYPRSASISINDELLSKKTPTEVPNLLPANYHVTISKPGYTNWQKELVVEPKKTTFIEDVTLFRTEPKIVEILKTEVQQTLCSNKDNKLAVINNTMLSIFDINRNKLIDQTPIDEKTEVVSWSNNSINVLLKDPTGYYIYSPDSKIKKLVTYNKKPMEDVVWESNSDIIVYGKFKNQLYKYNFSNDQAGLYDQTYDWQTVQPLNNTYIGIHKENDKMFLSIVEGKKVNDLMTIPTDDSYQINILSNEYILLVNKNLNVAYMINPNNSDNPLQSYVTNIKNFSWLNDSLLYWNDHEINVYHVPSKTKQTVERTSEKINQVSWHNGLVSIFAIINNQLKIFEFDNRDKRNVLDYQDLGEVNPNTATICFPKNSDELFTNYNTNEKQGIYRLTIQ